MILSRDKHVSEMRGFALDLNQDIGPMFGRDVARYIEKAERWREALEAADAWLQWCGPAGDHGAPEPDFPDRLVHAALTEEESHE